MTIRSQFYVLRRWREQAATPDIPAERRFMPEDPRTGQRRGFANLPTLIAFLENEIKEQAS